MAHAYTPGLYVSEKTRHRARRVLPIPGRVLVSAGDRVRARDVVARTELPGEVTPINLSNHLALPPGEVPAAMLKQVGDVVEQGELLARTKGVFGLFKADYHSRTAGTIESISNITGQVLIRGEPIPVQVQAYLAGEIIEVIPNQGVVVESAAAFVQGIFGVGPEAYGPVRMAVDDPGSKLTPDLVTEEMRGCIVIGGARMTGETVARAIAVGAAGVISGGIDDQDLKQILGYDLGVAITGTEKIGITLIITEGFGDIAMAERTFRLLQSHEGAEASVNGATQIRAGVMRPEIVIALPAETADVHDRVGPAGEFLEIGVPVRIIRDPYFGILGRVSALPHEPQTLPSGSKARVLAVQCDDGQSVVVPRANVEIVGA